MCRSRIVDSAVVLLHLRLKLYNEKQQHRTLVELKISANKRHSDRFLEMIFSRSFRLTKKYMLMQQTHQLTTNDDDDDDE